MSDTRVKFSYTIPEAAEATGVSEKAIRAAIQARTLPARRQPTPEGDYNERGKFLILAADLDTWVNEMPAA